MELIFHFCHCFDFIFLAGKEEERRKEELLKKNNNNNFIWRLPKLKI